MKALKNVILYTGILFLIWFIIPFVIYGILNAGNIAGAFASALIIFYGIFFEKVNKFIVSRKILLVLCIAVIIFIAVFKIYGSVKIFSAVTNKADIDTTVVVLGCQVKPTGPSLMLKERLVAAENFLKENPNLKCILSGGQGADEPMSEAQAMYDWLISRGIEKDRLYLENKSTSTQENIEFSKKVIEENGLIPEITIITNEFHQYRAKEIARKLGIESYSVSGKTLITFFPTFFLREIGGILYELIRSII